MRAISLLLIYVALILSCKAQVMPYKIGEKVKNFTLVNVVNDRSTSLNDFSSKKVLVVVFTSHSCPYSKVYDDRIIELYREYEHMNVQFILINPQSTAPEDQVANMVLKAKEKKFPFPFLTDPAKETTKAFGATKTPEVFVLKNINGNFILLYKGAIDDNPQLAKEASAHYLKDAIYTILSDGAVKISEKRATGCVIK